MRRNKYGARKTTLDGITFASRAEARVYRDLTLRLKAGEIKHLECQPRFRIEVSGRKICDYLADFRVIEADGRVVIIDVKSGPTKTSTYRLKKKLVEALHGIIVTEVE